MALKILAVDDSATMRKIMEMTFAGEDAEVVTVGSGDNAVSQAKSFQPDLVFADASMSPMDGYAIAQAIKADNANVAVIVMASQHNPFDENKGRTSGVDDHVAKPFDSQVVLDKVAQVLAKPRAQAAAGAPAAPAPPSASRPKPPSGFPPRSSKRTMAFGTPPRPQAPPKSPAKPVLELAEEEPAAKPAPRAATAPSRPKPPPPRPAAARPKAPPRPAPRPAPAPAKPAAPARPAPSAATTSSASAAPSATAPSATAPSATAPSVSAATDGMAGKLEGLGLTEEQVAGVLALSREVIEQVVWEVVPDLAETLIREELKRLTAE